MKRMMTLLLTALCLMVCVPACAQTFYYNDFYAKITVPKKEYTLLTADNLDMHPVWVETQGSTPAELAESWREDGVLLTAVALNDDVNVVITAVKNDETIRLFDLDQQTTATRTSYKAAFTDNDVLQDEGYTFQSATWENDKEDGRFLVLKYKRALHGKSSAGYAYHTIRNGYAITIDYQVYDRNVKNADLKALESIMKTFEFSMKQAKPAASVPHIDLTDAPPTETNTGKFTVAGTCDPGLKLTGVILRMSSPEPILIEKTANNSGKFTMNITLPEEGVWLMTLTVQSGDVITEEIVFNTTTYQKTLLPVNFTSDIPAVIYDDQLTISGTTLQGVQVQCLSGLDYAKMVKVNSTGKFSFKLPTTEAGEYDITLVFSKKNLDTRRYTFTVNRVVTDEQQQDRWRDDAVKPAYTTLTSKLEGYTGRVMGYDLYLVEAMPDENGYLLRMAMTKNSKSYKSIVYVRADELPAVEIGGKVKMYGECIGSLEVTLSDGTTESCPAFALLFWD